MTHFARALGAARLGNPTAAKADVAKVVELREKLREAKDAYWTEQVDIQWQIATAWMFQDLKSTRLNSSHSQISYAVFCLKNTEFSSGKLRPHHETNINIIARRTGKDVNSHTVLDGIITTIMATIQRINIIGSREGSRNRRRLKANQTGKKFRVGIKSNISTNRNNLISGVDRCIHLNAMKKTTITSINRQTIKI